MKNKKFIYSVGCAIGGCSIGFFANKIDTILGSLCFTIGVVVLAFSAYKVSKQ